jgi:SAM-dependent methyltransferase
VRADGDEAMSGESQQHLSERFSDRVDFYLRARPRYPSELIPFFVREMGLTSQWHIADVGSGTGFFSEPFLGNGNEVIGVEPNTPMRQAAEQLIASKFPKYQLRAGTAEATGLPDHSVDLVTAAQAFHWFDHAAARREFLRILKPGGWVALVWNNRRQDDPFSGKYQEIVHTYARDHQGVARRSMHAMSDDVLDAFFGTRHAWKHGQLSNSQTMNFAALRDRLLSSSYMPLSEDPRFDPMIRQLRAVFDRHQRDGVVRFEYDTDIYYGRLIVLR